MLILTVSKCKLIPKYEKNTILFINQLDYGTEMELENTLNTLPQKGDFSSSDYEYLLAINPQISAGIKVNRNEIISLKNFYLVKYEGGLVKAKSLYNDSLRNYLERNFKFEFLKNELLLSNVFSNQLLELIYKTNHHELNIIEFYSYIGLLVEIADKLKEKGYNELHLSLINYGLHIIATNRFGLECIKYKCQLNELKLKELYELSIEIDLLAKLYHYSYLESKKLNSQDLELVLNQTFSVIDSTLNIYYPIDSISLMQISMDNKRFIAIDIGFKFMDTKPLESLEYFDYVISTFGNECHWMKNYTYDVLGIVYEKLEDFDKSIYYFNLSSNIENCNEQNSADIQFSNVQLQMNYAEKVKAKMKPWEIFEIYNKQRKISLDVFKNESDHYNDYYVQSVANSIDPFIKEPIYDKTKILEILNLVSSSKSREVKRRKLIDAKNDELLDNKRITELKLKFNNFLDIENFQNPEREELFKLLLYEKMNSEDFKIVSVPNQFNIKDIKNLLNNKNEAFLDFLQYEDRLFGIQYFNNKLTVQKFDASLVDSLVRDLNQQILTKNDFSENLIQLKEIFSNKFDNKIKLLKIRSDGTLNNAPLDIIFDIPIQLVGNNVDFTEYKTQYLNSSNSAFFSFSNDSSLYSQEKRLIPELKYGFSEANEINKVLGSNSEIVSGKEMTKANFINLKHKDILHISSHAYSSKDNRYDNYFILRNSDYSLDTLYSYEISDMNNIPNVAIISACESGLGKHINGKGTYDIGRAFLNNGSQAVIKSLWKVNDKSTQVFMVQLYTYWNSGISLHNALDMTRSYMKTTEYAHPYYWAGFILEGNGQLFLN